MAGRGTSVGLDVHARSVAAAAIDGVTGALIQAKLTPSYEHVRSWIQDLPGPVAVTYAAGPTGFGLHRALSAAGMRCLVATPSKLQRPSGDRVRIDAKDALHLARAREDCRGDLMRARHRLSKLLLRHGAGDQSASRSAGLRDR